MVLNSAIQEKTSAGLGSLPDRARRFWKKLETAQLEVQLK
jgi:hypothetical protein